MVVVRVALAATAAFVAFPLMAASGGGGGSLPSASAPQYDPVAEYRSGVAALQQEDFKAAEKHFARVVSASPRDANSHYLLGLAKSGQNKDKAALKSFARAVQIDGDMIRARQQLGVTQARLGDRAAAEAELAELKRRKDACGGCAGAADLAAAVSAVETAIGTGPQAARGARDSLMFASLDAADASYLDAVGLINEGRYADAIAQLETARASFGPHPDILTYIGFANRKLGRLDAAETYYRAALAAAPEHKGATEYYGELKIERGDIAGAEAMLARLDALCSFGCAETEELRRWIDAARSRS